MTRQGLLKQIQRRNEPLNRIEELEREKCELLGIIQCKDKIINDLRNDWIDLVSNPDNLPEYEQPVEIWLEGCEYPRVAHRESLGGGTWRWWVYWGSGYEIGNKSIVVAWRKIVPPRSKNEN